MKIKELGDAHFNDAETTKEDKKLGGELANVIGDTFICSTHKNGMSSSEQWFRIAKALRVHGLKIVEATEEGKRGEAPKTDAELLRGAPLADHVYQEMCKLPPTEINRMNFVWHTLLVSGKVCPACGFDSKLADAIADAGSVRRGT